MKTLKAIRTSKGVTKKAMASHLGIARPTYDDYEEHPNKIRVGTARQIAEFLSVDVGDIFFADSSN